MLVHPPGDSIGCSFDCEQEREVHDALSVQELYVSLDQTFELLDVTLHESELVRGFVD